MHDHASTKKADTGHDSLRHARWIEADRFTRHAYPVCLVDGDQHQDAGRQANKCMGAKTGRSTTIGSLIADE